MKVSYKQLPANVSKKEDFKRQDITTNFKSIDTSFDKLSGYLQYNGVIIANSVALKNGYRKKKNAILPATIEFLALDIDKTTLSIDEMHEILREEFDLNHILVATSDPDEAYKYRLFLQTTPIIIKSEEEYKSLFDDIPSYIEFDKVCIDIARPFFIYANSAYTIKEYFKGNPLEIKENEIDRTISLSMCSRAERSEAHSSNGKLTKYTLKRSELSNTLKTRKCLWWNKNNKTWYAYEVIHSHPKLLDEENIYKLLQNLAKYKADKIRLSPTEKRKFSIRPDEKVCSCGFFFSNDCILFNDLGTDEESYDIIDFLAKLLHGKIDKSSRDDICERLIKFFNLPKINPYCLE